MSQEKYFSPREIYKIIVVGDYNVGKSMIIRNFLELPTEVSEPTIGVEFYSYQYDDSTKFMIWDLSGHKTFNKLIETYYNDIHGIVFVFDLTVRKSFENINNWLLNISKKIIDLDKKHFLLIGNKIDKGGRAVTSEEASQYASLNNMLYYEINYKNSITPLNYFFRKIATKYINNPKGLNCFKDHNNLCDYVNFSEICLSEKNLHEQKNKKKHCCILQ